MPSLQQTDVNGRSFYLLGQQQQVQLDHDAASTYRELFVFGNSQWPIAAGRGFCAYIFVTPEDGTLIFPANTTLQIGAQATPTDWTGGVLDISGQPAPITLYAQMAAAGGGGNLLPVYGKLVSFGITPTSIGTVSCIVTVSCYGWAE